MASPVIQFFFGGGWTLILVAILVALQTLGVEPFLSRYNGGFALFFMYLGWFINAPHAMWSYRFLYQQGNRFIFRHALSLILIPCFLLVWVYFAIIFWYQPIADFSSFIFIDRFFQKCHIFLNYSMYSGLGPFLFANLLMFQAVAVARHYVMQSLGICFHYAQKSGYPLSASQRHWMRYNMLCLWFGNICWLYTSFSPLTRLQFQYFAPRLPEFFRTLTLAAFLVNLAGLTYFVVWANWKRYRRMPSLVTAIPIVSTYAWMQPFWTAYGFQIWIVPLAHCIQYLYFCYFVERGKQATLGKLTITKEMVFQFSAIGVVIGVAGYAAFEFIPGKLDSFKWWPIPFFVILAANVLINMHHYLIDGVIWKDRASLTREHLLIGLKNA
jgi:hypothetical protein